MFNVISLKEIIMIIILLNNITHSYLSELFIH